MTLAAPESSGALLEEIRGAIAAAGPIPFARFMDLALYHPEHGYYSRGLGGGGGRDYLTSSGVHRAYGALLARQAEEMWELLGAPPRFRFVELGPGEGHGAADFLSAAAARPAFAGALEYLLVETSPALRLRQRRRLERFLPIPDSAAAIGWRTLEELEAERRAVGPFDGCLFANEVLDAFPVHRVVGGADGLREIHVTGDGAGLTETLRPPSSPALARCLEERGADPLPGQEVDVAPEADRFVGRAAALLGRGWFLIVDYGHEAPDLYHPARRRGTLLAYHRHRVSDDLLARPGEQDLTAHVDFTAATRAAEAAGLERLGLVSQAHFLLALGALDWFAAEDLAGREALKDLVLPDRMGGVFRVLALAAGGAPAALRGLSAPWREIETAGLAADAAGAGA